jgi:hypothetical protein
MISHRNDFPKIYVFDPDPANQYRSVLILISYTRIRNGNGSVSGSSNNTDPDTDQVAMKSAKTITYFIIILVPNF